MHIIYEHIVSYYKTLVTTNHAFSNKIPKLYPIPHPFLSIDASTHLSLPVTAEEIKNALFLMHPHKRLGPDGLHPFFFQKFWNITNQKLIPLVTEVFLHNKIPTFLNKIFISLIPKINNP